MTTTTTTAARRGPGEETGLYTNDILKALNAFLIVRNRARHLANADDDKLPGFIENTVKTGPGKGKRKRKKTWKKT